MARFTKDLTLNKPENFVEFVMNDYLQKNKFSMSDWKGEPAYRAGDAMMEGFKFLKWSYQNGVLHVEAWLKGSFGGEWNLEGFVGCLQKKPYKESLEQLFTVLQQDVPEGEENILENTISVPVQTVDNTGAATQALLFGILSVVLAFIIPLFGILFACLGYARARMGSGSSKAKQANIGKILCIIGIVVSVALWVLNIILSVL